jgi:hypothetical protein
MSIIAIAVSGNPAVAQVATPPSVAQEAPSPGGMQIFVTPYLWLPGVYATTATPLARASEVNSSVGPFELLGKLEGAPFMGSAEIRDGPIGLLGDVVHGPFGSNITTRNVFYQGGHAALNTNIGTALIIYRVLDAPNQFADLGVGFRSWGVDANLSLNPGLLQGEKVYRRAGWGDPLIGGRYHFDFNNGIGLSAYGDVGGFDLGAHTDWQVIGHGRLRPQFVDQPSPRLSQPQHCLHVKQRQSRLQHPYEGADLRRHFPVLGSYPYSY